MSKNDSPCGDWLLKVILGWSLSAWMRLIFEYSAKRDAGDLRLPKFQHLMASLNSRSLSTESAEILNFGVERIGESGLGCRGSKSDPCPRMGRGREGHGSPRAVIVPIKDDHHASEFLLITDNCSLKSVVPWSKALNPILSSGLGL